jgi:hypothetical protein
MSRPDAPHLLLSEAEIERLSGGHTQPRRQLEELHRRGFWRARLSREHKVILEREHYRAVCRGAVDPGAPRRDTGRPELMPVGRKSA